VSNPNLRTHHFDTTTRSTRPWQNTLDAGTPTSQISRLASDNEGNNVSGLLVGPGRGERFGDAMYDVYVRQWGSFSAPDGNDTSTSFTGLPAITYAFTPRPRHVAISRTTATQTAPQDPRRTTIAAGPDQTANEETLSASPRIELMERCLEVKPTINWGDGHIEPGSLFPSRHIRGHHRGMHRYIDNGSYTVTLHLATRPVLPPSVQI